MVRLKLRRGPAGPYRSDTEVEHKSDSPVYSYIPQRYREMDLVDVRLNGKSLNDGQIMSIIPEKGDVITVTPVGGVIGTLISIAVSVLITVGTWAYENYIETPMKEKRALYGMVGSTYSLDVMANRYKDGAVIPVVMGRHRCGGIILQQFTNYKEHTASLADDMTTHMLVSQGPIEGISDVYTNGNTISSFGGASWAYNPGILNPASLGEGFRELVTTTAQNDQLNTPGGGVNTITMLGTTDCHDIRIKMTFVSGLYETRSGHARYQMFPYKTRWRRSALQTNVDQNSAAAQRVLYVTSTTRFLSGDNVIVDSGGAKEEVLTIDTVQDGASLTMLTDLVYAHNQVDAETVDGDWAAWDNKEFMQNIRAPFSIFRTLSNSQLGGVKDTYDIRLELRAATHNEGENVYGDAYIKEFQEIDRDELLYPWWAVAGVTFKANEQANGSNPKQTFLVQGIKVNSITSGTLCGASAWTRKPAPLLLAMIYNKRWGLGNYFDTRMEVTLAGVAGGPYTVGEQVLGPADDYQFKGTVKSWAAATSEMIVECDQGVPHGVLTGQTSGATGTMSSIDEAYAVDLPMLYELQTFNAEQVPDGATGTTVDVNSNSGQKILSVAATTMFTAGDSVAINYEGDRAETGVIDTIQAGVSITLVSNLTYTHTLAQADEVCVAEDRHYFDYVWLGNENCWDALERICKCSRAMAIRYGGTMVFRPLKEETPGQLVCMSTVAPGSFGMSIKGKGKKPNKLHVMYLDEDLDYREQPAPYEDPTAYTNSEDIFLQELELHGVTRRSQALREARFRLKRFRYVGKDIRFTIGWDCLDFQVGDVIHFSHDSPGLGDSGHVVSAASQTVRLNRPTTLAGGETIRVRHTDDTQEVATISNGAGTYSEVSITAPWGTTPTAGTPFVVGDAGRFRVVSVKMTETFHAEIQAEEDSAAYYSDNFGVIPAWTETNLPDPDQIPGAVTDLAITEVSELSPSGEPGVGVQVAWQNADHSGKHENAVYYRLGLGSVSTYGRKIEEGETMGNETLRCPMGVFSYGDYVYFTDSVHHRVVKLDYADFAYDSEIGTFGVGNNNFSMPTGIWGNGTHLFICDSGNDRVKKHLMSDLSFVAATGTTGAGNGQFKWPCAITGNSTDIFVVDMNNHRVQRFDFALAYEDQIGGQGAGVDQFESPSGIACNVAGTLILVADTGNYRVAKIDENLDGNAGAGTWATVGTQGYDTDKFCGPRGVGIDHDDTNFFVTDCGYDGVGGSTLYSRVMSRKFSDMSAVTTVFPNSASEMGVNSGTGSDELWQPHDIDMDQSNDSLFSFIADRWNNRIVRRPFSTDGPWILADRTEGEYLRIEKKFESGDYITAAVCPMSTSGLRVDPDDAAQDHHIFRGLGETPLDVSGLWFAVIAPGKCKLWWSGTEDPNTYAYEIRRGADIATAMPVLTDYRETLWEFAPAVGISTKYWVAGVNRGGKYSATWTSIAADPSAVGTATGTYNPGHTAQTINIRTGV